MSCNKPTYYLLDYGGFEEYPYIIWGLQPAFWHGTVDLGYIYSE